MTKSNTHSPETEISRDQVIIRTSIIGIITNVFLAAFKAAIGILSNSIAVTLDAVNNLSDALSSIITIKSGIEMMIETLDEILGQRADQETTTQIKKLLAEEPEVRGAYDLIIHNYGPDKNLASVHLELPDTMTVKEVDRLTRKAEAKVYKETGVILTGVGVYSYNTEGGAYAKIQNDVRRMVLAHDWTVQLHGFYLDMEKKEMTFDVVMNFDIKPKEGLQIVYDEVQKAYPDYKIMIAPDVDISTTY